MAVRIKNWLCLGCLAGTLGVTSISPQFLYADDAPPLEGTQPLRMEGDIASQLVDGVDKFLLRQIEASVDTRKQHWKRDLSSAEAYTKSIEPNRQRLAHILGVRDARIAV